MLNTTLIILKDAAFFAWWWFAWCAVSVAAMPSYILILCLQLIPPMRPLMRPVADWMEVNIWAKPLVRSGFHKVTFRGADKLRPYRGRSAQIITNHASWLDIPLLMALLPNVIRFVTKAELLWVPLLNIAQLARRDIFINRRKGKNAIGRIGTAMRRLRHHGLWFLSFPEGTRSRDGSVHTFKKTPTFNAIEAQIPLIAIAISGTFNAMPKTRWQKQPSHLVVEVVEVLETAGLTADDAPRITAELEHKVREIVERNNQLIVG
jgi:1-acyl-sn-glycerol-3-phosphate acyltransferase